VSNSARNSSLVAAMTAAAGLTCMEFEIYRWLRTMKLQTPTRQGYAKCTQKMWTSFMVNVITACQMHRLIKIILLCGQLHVVYHYQSSLVSQLLSPTRYWCQS